MDVDGSFAAASPAPSASQALSGKRGARGPYKKVTVNTTTDNIDAEGRLPGSKDGLGAFPPGSDWAKLMLALKRKGKQCDCAHFASSSSSVG
jgi:bromodomain-containing protein 7